MKKNALVVALAALGGVAYAGADYVSASANPYSWEVAAVYNHALTDIDETRNTPSVDTYGIDVTGIYSFRENQKFTLRLGYATGEQAGFNVTNLALMPGYRYEKPINDKLVVFAGAGLGLGFSMLDTPTLHRQHNAVSDKDDMLNIVYNVEAGARYAIRRNLWVMGAVSFNGGTSPLHSSAAYGTATEEQMNIGVRLGIGGQF